jgi:hypothetical protein
MVLASLGKFYKEDLADSMLLGTGWRAEAITASCPLGVCLRDKLPESPLPGAGSA